MMRSLRVSIAMATALLQLVACGDGTRTESAAARAQDSSLARDLEIAGATDSIVAPSDGRDTRAVTESPGMLDSSKARSPRIIEDPATRNVSDASRANTSSTSSTASTESPSSTESTSSTRSTPSTANTPSADGYIGPSCASPALDDQQRCLLGYLARSDARLDRNYQALIRQLKSEAGVRPNAPEPTSVQRLRSAQRSWLVYRDEECRKRTRPREGPLWAPVRAECLAEYSALRERELQDALAKRKALRAKAEPAKSKRTSGTSASGSRTRG